MTNTSSSKALHALRQLMVENQIDYYYVPTRDDHNNEYVPPHWQRRDWLTGFTGSYGQALVGLNEAFVWTDPRYFLQAETQLNPNDFEMKKQLQGSASPISDWLTANASHCIVAVDPKLMSINDRDHWIASLATVGSTLTAIPNNLVDAVWVDQPDLALAQLRVLPEKYTGLSAMDKISQVRAMMKSVGADALVVSILDEIAWLFNIRGNDIPYNPLVISYALVTQDQVTLFTEMDRVSDDVRAYCQDQNITLKSYGDFEVVAKQQQGNVWVDPATTSWWVADLLSNAQIIPKASPLIMMKAIKNKTELAGAYEAHRVDALAVVQFLHWLDSQGDAGLNEVLVADQLEVFRKADARCVDLSFNTICGFADHGAIVHYGATEDSAHVIDDSNMLLIDSGGQYYEGTTDITRTVHLGEPTDAQKRHYTLVLKGHLALRHAIFPQGICGEHLNPLARLPLWQAGMDFGHGTGHGVGSYLCVHEGPQRISGATSGVPLVPGMIVSNEPGLYLDGQYGIRIENLCAITPAISVAESATGDGPFYTLDDLTIVPYARKLIDASLLTAQEVDWVNSYHQKVYKLLSADLPKEAAQWLKAVTDPL